MSERGLKSQFAAFQLCELPKHRRNWSHLLLSSETSGHSGKLNFKLARFNRLLHVASSITAFLRWPPESNLRESAIPEDSQFHSRNWVVLVGSSGWLPGRKCVFSYCPSPVDPKVWERLRCYSWIIFFSLADGTGNSMETLVLESMVAGHRHAQ